jgi:hypothetical protein
VEESCVGVAFTHVSVFVALFPVGHALPESKHEAVLTGPIEKKFTCRQRKILFEDIKKVYNELAV